MFTTSYTVRSHNLYIIRERDSGVVIKGKKKGTLKENQHLQLPVKRDASCHVYGETPRSCANMEVKQKGHIVPNANT